MFAHAGKYQLFGEPYSYRLFSHSLTRISKIVLELKMCFNSNTVECILVHLPDLHQIYSETSRFKRNILPSNPSMNE